MISKKIERFKNAELLDSAEALGVPVLFVRPTFQSLITKKILIAVQYLNAPHYELNSEYADEFYDLAKSLGLITADDSVQGNQSEESAIEAIPAADRFVTVDHNSESFIETVKSLDALVSSIEGANRLTADHQDRLQISKEINYVKELISEPRVHLLAIWDYAKNNHTLKWLTEQTISSAVRQAALDALKLLFHFVKNHI